jgi:hypothetical protein
MIGNKMKTKEREQMRYYFNQYWTNNNPEVLRCGKLTDLLQRIYKQEWEKVPRFIERRLFIINANFKYRF